MCVVYLHAIKNHIDNYCVVVEKRCMDGLVGSLLLVPLKMLVNK
jgi:hypothetical protein